MVAATREQHRLYGPPTTGDLLSYKKLNKRLMGFALKLINYNITVVHRKGEENSNADTISRQAWDSQNPQMPHAQKKGISEGAAIEEMLKMMYCTADSKSFFFWNRIVKFSSTELLAEIRNCTSQWSCTMFSTAPTPIPEASVWSVNVSVGSGMVNCVWWHMDSLIQLKAPSLAGVHSTHIGCPWRSSWTKNSCVVG